MARRAEQRRGFPVYASWKQFFCDFGGQDQWSGNGAGSGAHLRSKLPAVRVPRACLIGKQTLVRGGDKCTGGLLSSHLILTSPRFKIERRRSGEKKE